MGNTQGKSKACKEALSSFDTNEVQTLTDAFKSAASRRKPEDCIDATSLGEALNLQSSTITEKLFKVLQRAAGSSKEALSFDDFTVALAKCCSSSSRYDKRKFWLSVVVGDESSLASRDVIRAVVEEEVTRGLPPGASSSLKSNIIKETLDSVMGDSGSLSYDDAEKWLKTNQTTEGFLTELVQGLFLRGPSASQAATVPMPTLGRRSALLKEEHLWALARQLPSHCVKAPWKRLYNSAKHGQSFARMVAKTIFKGPTVAVIRDKGGCVFGMFAAASWRKHNQFYGESTSFVFTLAPKCKTYRSSGVNQNYQFLATTLTPSASCANGMGMGGQMDFWGIHIDDRLEKGVCRAPCSTFIDMPLLSSDANFDIDVIEVWGCDPTYVADEKELEAAGVKKKKARTWEEYERQGHAKTCLDGNVDSQAILEAAGRTNYSADVRAADAVMEKERLAAGGGRRTGGGSSSDEDELVYDN